MDWLKKLVIAFLGLFGLSTVLSDKKSKEVKATKKAIKKTTKKIKTKKKAVASAKKKSAKASKNIAEQNKVIENIKNRKAEGRPPTKQEAKEALEFLKDFTKDYEG